MRRSTARGKNDDTSLSVQGPSMKISGLVAKSSRVSVKIRMPKPENLLSSSDAIGNSAIGNGNGNGDTIERLGSSNKVIFTFGRFQPPTVGHGVLIQTLQRKARDSQSDCYVFVSRKTNDLTKLTRSKAFKGFLETQEFFTCDINENPLSVGQKVSYLKTMFPSARVVNTETANTPDVKSALKALYDAGYREFTMLVGSDRVMAFEFLKNIQHEDFQPIVLKLSIEQAGEERDETGVMCDRTALNGMSGSKMRLAAVSGNFSQFQKGLKVDGEYVGTMDGVLAKKMMNDIRKGLGFGKLGEMELSGGRKRKS